MGDREWLVPGLGLELFFGVLLGAGLLLDEPLAESLADPLALADPVPLDELLPLPELPGPGENVGVDGEDPEQPAIEAGPRTAKVTQLAAASLVLSPVGTLGLPMLRRSPHRSDKPGQGIRKGRPASC